MSGIRIACRAWSRGFAALVVVLVAVSGLLLADPASATAPPVGTPSDPNPGGPDTETTIVDMIDTGGLFGGTAPTAGPQTPYPSSGLQDLRPVTTAQLVLDDPGTPQRDDILAYCIDLATDTTIGIHYELGTWAAANVPNPAYVEWVLDHYFPEVPTAPAGIDAEKVRAVQGAIWYFTDRFVVAPAYPTERDAVRTIVEAAQTALAGGTTATPVPPSLTITPPSINGTVSGDLVGPFTVLGSGGVTSATIAITGTQVYSDAAGTQPVANGATVGNGGLWARYDAQVTGQGFALTAYAPVVAGNVYLYDGGNPPRRTAQKLVLAKSTTVPLRAAAQVTPADSGALHVDVVVTGAAAGQQGRIEIVATCDGGPAPGSSFTRWVPADSAAGSYGFDFEHVPSTGATCRVAQPSSGTGSDLEVVTTIDPASIALAAGQVRTITVTDTYTAAPAPTPPPTPAVLPATGQTGPPPWLPSVAAVSVLTGVGIVATALRRRSRRGRRAAG